MRRSLRSLGLAAALVAFGLAPAFAEAPPSDVAEVLAAVQRRYETTGDFTASFRQIVEVRSIGREMVSTGMVAFKRPGRMFWDFETPERQVIVADGETLWIHQPEQSQVLKMSFDQAFRSTMPVTFLLGLGRLEHDFDASIAAEDETTIRLRLVPKKDADVGTVFLVLDRGSHEVLGAEVHDPLGNRTRVEFHDIARDVGLEDEKFRFVIPEGADVIAAPEPIEEAPPGE